MISSPTIWLAIIVSVQLVHGYVDFGTVTAPCNFEPIFTVPRPKFVPEDAYIRYEPYSSSITAVAPSLRLGANGTHETSWSLHFVEPPMRTTRSTRTVGELRRRGVFSGDPAIPTCRPCDRNGNPIDNGGNGNGTNTSGAPHCSVTDYGGVFRDGLPISSGTPSYCFNSGYTGPLVPTPIPTDASLPCCPICYPPNSNGTSAANGTNTSFTATTGVFSPTTTPRGTRSTTTTPRNTGSTTTSKATPGSNGGKETVTVTATKPITVTQTTLSIETITPTTNPGSPVTTTGYGTIVGCGTASGCGTVIGSGTVYLSPLGYPIVTSSGTISGCAPKIIGCGTIIATTGTFTAPSGTPATITACGEGTGSATLIGTGTVWPAGFNDMISFVSSGTLTGSGRVRGCGTITGVGTFTVRGPYTGVSTPATTVNVYVSYCPGDLGGDILGAGAGLRLSSNFTDDDDSPSFINPHAYDGDENDEDNAISDRYALSAFSPNGTSPYPYSNSTNSTLTNQLCRICPQDSGICCPPFTDCGGDGHCPWAALVGCGYTLHGFNIVNMGNSSGLLGSGGGASRLKAPGLPGSGGAKVVGSESEDTDGDSSRPNGSGTAPANDGTSDPAPTPATDHDSTASPFTLDQSQLSQPISDSDAATPSPSSLSKEHRFKRHPYSVPKAENRGWKLSDEREEVHVHGPQHERREGQEHAHGHAHEHGHGQEQGTSYRFGFVKVD